MEGIPRNGREIVKTFGLAAALAAAGIGTTIAISRHEASGTQTQRPSCAGETIEECLKLLDPNGQCIPDAVRTRIEGTSPELLDPSDSQGKPADDNDAQPGVEIEEESVVA